MKKLINKPKWIWGITISVLIITCTVGVTLALLKSKTVVKNNSFAGSIVNVAVKEGDQVLENGDNSNTYISFTETNQTVAKDVKITNLKGNGYSATEAYVRVRLVPVLRYTSGEFKGKTAPIDASKVTYTYGDLTAWEQAGDYYYYKEKLLPGTDTTSLITEVRYFETLPEDTKLEVQVLTEAISAKQQTEDGTPAANEAWNVTLYK